jgi:O-antigen ligase
MGAALAGSAIAFTAAPGSLGDLMALCGAVFAANVLVGNYRVREITRGHWLVLGIVALLLLQSLPLFGVKAHDRSLRYFMLFPGMVMACHVMARQSAGVRPELRAAALAAVVCICVSAQTIAFQLQHPPDYFGFYDNPHHLGLFASLALPVLGWAAYRMNGWRRAATLPWGIAAFFLLWQSGSRISWVVFFGSAILAAVLFMPRRKIIAMVGGIGLLALTSAWLSGFGSIVGRINDFRINLKQEERVVLWPATIEVLARNTAREWVLGHGIGSFRSEFPKIAPDSRLHIYAFPHNALLQIIFENGITGLGIMAAGLGVLMWRLFRKSHRPVDPAERHLRMTLFALLCIVAGQCLLTKSLYSRYIMYSLGVIIGVFIVVLDENRPECDGAHERDVRLVV